MASTFERLIGIFLVVMIVIVLIIAFGGKPLAAIQGILGLDLSLPGGDIQQEEKECVLKKTYWESEEAVAGESVGIVVESSGCKNKMVSVTIFEYTPLSLFRERVDSFSFELTSSRTVYQWVAEYRSDIFTDPEYRFVVMGGEEGFEQSLSSSAPGTLLEVKQQE